MRVLSAVAAVIFVLLAAVAPFHVSAQEAPGHILFSVRVCLGDHIGARVVGTFADVPCESFVGSRHDTYMVISLDGGEFVDGTSTLTLPLAPILHGNLYLAPGDGTSTLTLPLAPILHGNLYLAPGDYTLTITSEQLTGPLVSSIDLHIVAGDTLPLTYTVTYGLTLGSEPPPAPVDTVPEIPVDPPATPVATMEVPVDDPAGPPDPIPTDDAEVPGSDISDAPSAPIVIATLPNTGTGYVTSSSAFARVSLLLAAFGVLAGATATRLRRT